jgi:DNA gyrase inhibitor GyrI
MLMRLFSPTLVLLALLLPLPAMAIEEPDYSVVQRLGDDIEVREYASYRVAEYLHTGPRERLDRESFNVLFDYISGANGGARKIAMTAPVTTRAAGEQTTAERGTRIAMTAPVTRSETPAGWVVQFVMPREFTLETLPQPKDPRVTLREIPAQRYAVIRYSGMWTERNYARHLAQLREACAREGLTTEGEPTLSRYNGPFVPPFFRRNEIWLNLR